MIIEKKLRDIGIRKKIVRDIETEIPLFKPPMSGTEKQKYPDSVSLTSIQVKSILNIRSL